VKIETRASRQHTSPTTTDLRLLPSPSSLTSAWCRSRTRRSKGPTFTRGGSSSSSCRPCP